MKTQYIIVKARNSDKLAEEGWIPQGGVCIANASNYIFTQALILKTE